MPEYTTNDTAVQVDVPTFELIDLPGLQLFPEQQEKLTMDLANKYLAEEDTLVLCVVDATLPSLTDSAALKMVRSSDKLSNTILALTKSDLVRTEPEVVKLFDRILGEVSDAADNSLLEGLAGCIAVANRNHMDHVSLVEAELEEPTIFADLLADPAPFYADPQIKEQLQQNMTIGQLIVQLDKLFHRFIVDKWRPAALAFLAPLEQEVRVAAPQQHFSCQQHVVRSLHIVLHIVLHNASRSATSFLFAEAYECLHLHSVSHIA